jgi:DNA polymerase V
MRVTLTALMDSINMTPTNTLSTLSGLPVVSAGFPSPAADFDQGPLDMNDLLMPRPEASFLFRVKGPSMQDVHIFDGDVVVVDRSKTAVPGHIVVAELDGSFTIKFLRGAPGQYRLEAANPRFKPIAISEGMELRVFGVVTWIIHRAPVGKSA